MTFALPQPPTSVRVTLPIKTVSESNVRQHWAARHRRAKAQRTAAYLGLIAYVGHLRPMARWNVMLIRRSTRSLDDDNLRGALKAVRDGVADALGLKDDSDERVTWLYGQQAGPGTRPGVHIEVWDVGCG